MKKTPDTLKNKLLDCPELQKKFVSAMAGRDCHAAKAWLLTQPELAGYPVAYATLKKIRQIFGCGAPRGGNRGHGKPFYRVRREKMV